MSFSPRNILRNLPSWLLASLALLLVPALAQAQVLGSIQGKVVDPDGAALPGATVEVQNTQTGETRVVVTNEQGFYRARSLQSGIYTLTASLDNFQTVRRERVQLLVGQTLDIGFELGVEDVEEVITVTSEAPLVETSRSSSASYVGQEEIEALPITGRDFKEFAFLTPTVVNDPVRGFITMSGQRGIYTGLNIDGTSAKSAFFGYGRGGEATENDGLVVAQDSVKEFQVITNGFAPEYGANGGGYVNVITRSGTNTTRGSAFYYYRDDGMAEDFPASPLDEFEGDFEDTPVDEFERENFGTTLGGAIVKDKTHYFFSWDQAERTSPISRSLRTPGIWDLIMQRAQSEPGFANLLDGYERQADGSARGTFLRDVTNTILFGKIDQQFSDSNSGTFRVNYTDYERFSTFKDEESEKLEDTLSVVGSLVSLIGDSSVNEARVQYAQDNLDRLSQRVGEPVEAEIRFRFGEFDSVGKFDFLPIFVEEEKLQIQDNFSYLFGAHDLKFGVDYQRDDLSQLFAGSRDGRYDFQSAQDFLDNQASNVRIYFGDVTFPNYDETQELWGVYAQDSWRPNDQLTLNFGLRYNATLNPDDLEHIFPEGRDIPDDTDNWAPRFGFAYALGTEGRDVVRGGVGLFYGRTPALLFAGQVQNNGLFPNFGQVNVQPGDQGYVPLGGNIDNTNPPPDAPNSPSFVATDFEDTETLRVNLGYERELGNNWSAGVDLLYADGENLQSNIDRNRTYVTDEFGRPIALPTRPNPEFGQIFTRESFGKSKYQAVTLKANKRFSGKYQLNAHYTWSEDRDTDSNERSATSVTSSFPDNPQYDWGYAERDVEHRYLVSGLVVLPWDIKLSGIYEYRSGRRFDPTDASFDFVACGFTSLGFNCPNARPVDANGNVLERNAFQNESISRFDIRLTKAFTISNWEIDLFAEVFNVFDENSFEVGFGFSSDNERDPSSPTFGLGEFIVTTPRQFQIGARVSFN